MQIYESLKHTTWECKYHVVFIPKYRRKALYVQLRRDLGAVFRDLAEQKECKVEEGHLMPDHVHMLLSVPPKYAVSSVLGFIKGKSAIHIARVYAGRRCVDTSRSRRRKTNASNNWRWRRFERLTITTNPL